MPGFVHFLRCVGKAVVKNAGKALASLVPFGEVSYEIAKDAWEDFRRDSSEAERQLRSEVEQLAQAPQAELREAVEDVVADQPPEVRQALIAYLTQVPAGIRQSLRRPSDPSGRTVPAGLSLKRPEDLLQFLPAGLPRLRSRETDPWRRTGSWSSCWAKAASARYGRPGTSTSRGRSPSP